MDQITSLKERFLIKLGQISFAMHKNPYLPGVGAGLVAFVAGFVAVRVWLPGTEDEQEAPTNLDQPEIMVVAGSGSPSEADRFIASLSDDPEQRHRQLVAKLVEIDKILHARWGHDKFLADLLLKLEPILYEADLEQVLRDFSEEAGGGRYYSLKPILAEMLVEHYGGQRSWEIISSLPDEIGYGFRDKVISLWAGAEGLPAFYAALEKEKESGGYVLYHAVQELPEEDLPKVLEELLALPPGPKRSRIIENGIPLFGNKAPDLLRELFETTKDPEVRMRAAQGYAGHLIYQDTEKAWEFINGLEESLRAETQEYLVQFHSMDIDKTMEIHSRLPPGDPYNEMTWQLARQMASDRPDEAWEWALNLPRGAAQEKGATKVGREMAKYYPEKAMAGAMRLPEGGVREKVVEGILETWAEYAPQDALTKLESLPEDLRQKYRDPVMKKMAARNVEDALAYADNLPEGENRSAALGNILEYWRQIDGASAAGWSMENLDSPTLEKTIGQTVRFWTMHEQEKAEAFVPSLPEGPVRDEGYSGLGWATIWTQPDKGMAFARQIQDQEKRDKLVAKFFTRWKNRDRPAAHDWLANSDLSEHKKEQLLDEDTW